MLKSKKDLVQKLLKGVNLLLIAVIFELAWTFYYMPNVSSAIFSQYTGILLFVLYCSLYVMYAKIYDGFLILSSRIYELICGQALAAMIADVLMFIITWIMTGPFPSILPIIITFILQFAVSTLWSVVVHRWYFASHSAQKSIVISDDEVDVEDVLSEYGFNKMFSVSAIVKPSELIESGYAALEGIQTVFVACTSSKERNAVITTCVDRRKSIYLLPQPEDILLHGSKQVHMFHSAVMRFTRNEPTMGYAITKRAFDILVSATSLLILSPLMLVVAAAIRMEDHGPVFYKQQRLTKNGKVFAIYKFRSMRTDAEKDGKARLSTGDRDPRVTKVGHFIRKTRIDEIPQLINILNGDMTLVGPRPERPELTDQYSQEIPQFRQRLRVKAGLTGYAQVYGKYNTTPVNKLLMDLVYIEHRSLVEDMQIIFATVKVLFMPDATEGVAEGQMTAMKVKKDK